MGPIRLGSEKGLGPSRLGSEKVWVRVVPEILGPSRLGSELSDIRFICPCTGVKYHNIQTCLLVYAADLR